MNFKEARVQRLFPTILIILDVCCRILHARRRLAARGVLASRRHLDHLRDLLTWNYGLTNRRRWTPSTSTCGITTTTPGRDPHRRRQDARDRHDLPRRRRAVERPRTGPAHVKELLEQTAGQAARDGAGPGMQIGVYSAGLRRRDTDIPIIVAGIQSVYQSGCELDRFDLVLIDEAHMIPPEGDGMYQTFLPTRSSSQSATCG